MAKLLSNLRPPAGATKKKKRLGRGDSSGHGGTSTKGHKGQRARSGGYHKLGFEGGQMPLIRRIPKRGFFNPFRKSYVPINVEALSVFKAGDVVGVDELCKQGLVKNGSVLIKVLGEGDLAVALTVKAHAFSKSAKEKILKVGGSAEEVAQKAVN